MRKLGITVAEFKYLQSFKKYFDWVSVLEAWKDSNKVFTNIVRLDRFEECLIGARGETNKVKSLNSKLIRAIKQSENRIEIVQDSYETAIQEMESLLL